GSPGPRGVRPRAGRAWETARDAWQGAPLLLPDAVVCDPRTGPGAGIRARPAHGLAVRRSLPHSASSCIHCRTGRGVRLVDRRARTALRPLRGVRALQEPASGIGLARLSLTSRRRRLREGQLQGMTARHAALPARGRSATLAADVWANL